MANNISFGGGNGGGGSSTLSGLSDVTLSAPTNGQVLKYDGSKWVNGAGGGSSGHTYSTTEQEIGTWVDGSTLYEKTIDIGELPNNTTKSVAHNISNLSTVVYLLGFASNSSVTLPLPVPHPDNVNAININADATNINIATGRDRRAYSGYVTIRYTKSST